MRHRHISCIVTQNSDTSLALQGNMHILPRAFQLISQGKHIWKQIFINNKEYYDYKNLNQCDKSYIDTITMLAPLSNKKQQKIGRTKLE